LDVTLTEKYLQSSPAALVLQELGKGFLDPVPVMLVGAACRDALHAGCGFNTPLRGTDDLDVGIAVADWSAYEALVADLEPVSGSTSGIRYEVAGLPVDIMPFGDGVEVPDGVVNPPARRQGMSVFGFQDVWGDATELAIDGDLPVRLPSIGGYTLLKLRAWLDRAPQGNYKDAPDLACAMYWSLDPEDLGNHADVVMSRLYDTDEGSRLLGQVEFDDRVAAVRLLVRDAIGVLKPERRPELQADWTTGPEDGLLASELANALLPGWPRRGEPRLQEFAQAVRAAMIAGS
jgi:predicted nucleotidyltransferase